MEAFEEFVAEHPGATVLPADSPTWRCVGMSAFTPDESAVLYVGLPISSIREEASGSARPHILGDRRARQSVDQQIMDGKCLSKGISCP